MQKQIKQSIYADLVQDLHNNSISSFIILFFYRTMHWAYINKLMILLMLLSFFKRLAYFILSLNAQISYKAYLGKNIRLCHSANGVIVSKYAVIHNNVTIYHQTTIGINESLSEQEKCVEVQDNCYLSSGCKIISCLIGYNTKIAPNAVVFKNTPPHSLVYPVNETRIVNKNR